MDTDLMAWIAVGAAVVAVIAVGFWLGWLAAVALAGVILWIDAR